ncbi:MAG: NAD(P)/FAD-dependent oxidoreductase [Lachnospiraceae bacterium]|nr:NAD(P)/FAD-dependent oxidoreductase [Lachnospiraceae bacterium]
MKKKKIAVIGGGAAGMFAAVHAAANGCEVHLFEKNEKLGKKVYITGKGRCNLTNACETEELFDAVVTNPKFLYSAFYGYTNQDVIAFFEKAGMKTKTERGERVFPVSDHSTDVIDALRRKLREYKVQVHLNTEVSKVEAKDAKVTGVWLAGEKKLFPADAVLVATGGISYKTTGSTGDGYRFAEELGHKVTDLYPSLVPFNTREAWAKELQGLSLKNVDVRVMDGKKKLYDGFGEMMFTHFGVTGPLILSASSYTAKTVRKKELQLFIDLKPALSKEQLDHRILRDFEESRNKQFKNALGGLFPAKLTPVMIRLSGISPEKKVNEIAREERMAFVDLIKNLPLTITGLRDYNEAIITKGGVTVREVNPSTMESKLVKGLYFAGEVLDLDAVTGGFNLQIAWSTAYAAAVAMSQTEA